MWPRARNESQADPAHQRAESKPFDGTKPMAKKSGTTKQWRRQVKIVFGDKVIEALFKASPVLMGAAETLRDLEQERLDRLAEIEASYSPACLAMLRSRGII